MSRFLQMHALTVYPPSNPNRDDLGRPKTAVIGGVTRMRISSQALKRAIRTSGAFQTTLSGKLGARTQRLGEELLQHLLAKGSEEDKATAITREVVAAFGKLKPANDSHPVRIEQLAFVSPEEREKAFELAEKAAAGDALPKEKDLAKTLLATADTAVDIAMFGRMLAADPAYNREAAVQVAHAFTTNRVDVEDDYYTAVDDLKQPEEDAGAGFVGEAGFGAGVFYTYVCVNRELLVRNLAGDTDLAAAGLRALTRAVAEASPSGKKNSFGNHVRAAFMLLEKGDGQPINLASAFLKPVGSGDQMAVSIEALTNKRAEFARVYGDTSDEEICLDMRRQDSATLAEVADFAATGLSSPAA
ncbi:type I-E CRISPR-associated protein Cas7/Cse4/CasC [Afifella sp. H1R]|uniref:type I-E CRISPR-associated protein Cas7/Cse4/CasC n=1 Tax=Afifella sp. H1R TaxID=2908841 RepID=UPI001F3E9E83|nr:type I-E CRISPR-associated protein Cas7/Cse4/CasC [Afifella sp. H1R]MCF1506012.1 type I-E CRISPR-associated protein Cas7/Cse4/CasC [Afifella sp. H1R]